MSRKNVAVILLLSIFSLFSFSLLFFLLRVLITSCPSPITLLDCANCYYSSRLRRTASAYRRREATWGGEAYKGIPDYNLVFLA